MLPSAQNQNLNPSRAAAALLRAAAEFADPEWGQGALAQDPQGREVKPDNPEAARWCAHGRLRQALQTPPAASRPRREVTALLALNRCLPSGYALTAWNDQPGRTPEQVRRLFQQAAERLEQEAEKQTQKPFPERQIPPGGQKNRPPSPA